MSHVLSLLKFLVFCTIIKLSTGSSECEDGWRRHRGTCYLSVLEGKPFKNAVQHCLSMSAQLVEIEDAEENEFVHELLKSDIRGATWLGAKRIQGDWISIKSNLSLSFTYWENGTGDEENNCARMWKNDGMWHPIPCEWKKPLKFVCEKPATVLQWAIVGTVVAITLASIVAILAITFLCWRKRRAQDANNGCDTKEDVYDNACNVKADYDSENESNNNGDAVYANVILDGEATLDSKDSSPKAVLYATPNKPALEMDNVAVFMVDNSVYQ